jgi:hypothetical protein
MMGIDEGTIRIGMDRAKKAITGSGDKERLRQTSNC